MPSSRASHVGVRPSNASEILLVRCFVISGQKSGILLSYTTILEYPSNIYRNYLVFVANYG